MTKQNEKLKSDLGPVLQSIVRLTSSLVAKMLIFLVSTISNSHVFLLKNNVSSFCICKSYSHFFSKNISIYAIFNDQSLNDTLTNDIVSFKELGPEAKTQETKKKKKREKIELQWTWPQTLLAMCQTSKTVSVWEPNRCFAIKEGRILINLLVD